MVKSAERTLDPLELFCEQRNGLTLADNRAI